ncbi:serine hydrolase domain-containing protein [Nocardioides sp. T2.26MG-1]|uniref:serine hydrolase domain-containing protein n=1 Tax=Nocardioides sp. T2.26MG-1 TaxID=3041166 RepID=UPI0024773295|nr:serine hydrolase domain-containing protein [Nocardioides sp. T2.26MG-1]CAI9419706.1 Putative D-alanyl-D-alanine carboxypeptidase [Nocardioides sp. T2.26MG-1]
MSFTQAELETKLAELIDRHHVPGAQLAVLDGETITEAAAGVLSIRTGAPVTTDALFLPGSIGKLYTATLVLMLVDEGLIDLDRPVRSYLSGFEVRDHHARDTVTVRDLLRHTSGFDGDIFIDTGRGDDALERYLEEIADLPQICEPGAVWSYSNSGYAILGRLVEVVAGTVYETALRDRLLTPLGLKHSVVFPEEAITHPVSVGHDPDPEDPEAHVVSEPWGLFRSCGPMGASLVASAADVIRFALLHLDGGVSADGTRLLSADLVAAAQEPQVTLVDDTVLGEAWGLGWILDHFGDVAVIGHDGNSLGQNAFMRLATEQRFGFCLQTNVESALSMYRELAAWLFGERLGVAPRQDPEPLPSRVVADAERYVGTYRREGLSYEVARAGDGSLVASVDVTHAAAELQNLPPMNELPLIPVERDQSFLLKLPIADSELLAVFFNPDDDTATPTYLHFGGRAHRRVG